MRDRDDESELGDIHILITGGVHPAPPVEDEPDAVMTAWRVIKVLPSGERHLCGWVGYEGRVSSPVLTFDPQSRIATTRSGRRYRLRGPSGYDPDALWVWQAWSRANGVEFQEDVSMDYEGKSSVRSEEDLDSGASGRPGA